MKFYYIILRFSAVCPQDPQSQSPPIINALGFDYLFHVFLPLEFVKSQQFSKGMHDYSHYGAAMLCSDYIMRR
jgi:hypothetical protein